MNGNLDEPMEARVEVQDGTIRGAMEQVEGGISDGPAGMVAGHGTTTVDLMEATVEKMTVTRAAVVVEDVVAGVTSEDMVVETARGSFALCPSNR